MDGKSLPRQGFTENHPPRKFTFPQIGFFDERQRELLFIFDNFLSGPMLSTKQRFSPLGGYILAEPKNSKN